MSNTKYKYRFKTREEFVAEGCEICSTQDVQIISRAKLKEIYDVACTTWKKRIEKLAESSHVLSDNIEIPNEVVVEMFKASSLKQIKVLEKAGLSLPKSKFLKAKDVKIGQIVKIFQKNSQYGGEILLMTYAGLVSLTNPRQTWTSGTPDFELELMPENYTHTFTNKNN